MSKVRILCFGDSNVWGYIPSTDHERFSEKERFPKILQKLLGSQFEVIEDGLNSRTVTSEDTRPGKEGRKGSLHILPCLKSHAPLNLVILMLGTTELKERFKNSPEHIGNLLERYFVKAVLNSEISPKLLIVSPPIIDERTEYAKERYVGGTEKSKKLGDVYSEIARKNSCHFIDAGDMEVGSDGVHMTKESHLRLAKMLCEKIKSLDL